MQYVLFEENQPKINRCKSPEMERVPSNKYPIDEIEAVEDTADFKS